MTAYLPVVGAVLDPVKSHVHDIGALQVDGVVGKSAAVVLSVMMGAAAWG